MKFKKIAAVLTTAAISTGAMSVSAFADSKREYNCEWVDVRNTSNYELTVDKSVVDGKEMAVISLNGLPAELSNFNPVPKNVYSTCELKYIATTIDIGDSGDFLFFMYGHDSQSGKDKIKCTVASLGSSSEPINGKYCLYDDFYYGMLNSENVYYETDGNGKEFGNSKLLKTDDKLTTLECTVDYSNPIVAKLLKLNKTTVATMGVYNRTWNTDNKFFEVLEPEMKEYLLSLPSRIHYGIISSNVASLELITGDGKYIDCSTKKTIQEKDQQFFGKYTACCATVPEMDNLTDLPKEIVKITVKDSDAETTTAAEVTTADEVTTTTKVTPAAETVTTTEITTTTEAATAAEVITASESESSATSPTLTDKKTNITVTGSIPQNTTLKVEEKKTEDNFYTYDISIVDSKGNKVQPNGKVEVKLPIPEAFKDQSCYVYRIEADGSHTDMNAKAENGCLIFTTDHFSEYVISKIQLSSEKTENKNQATGVVLVLIPAAIAAAGIVISKKRK